MIKYVFLDFNGTIINDVDLCLKLLNELLEFQNKQGITLEKYKDIFTFPIIKYYEAAGIDFTLNPFDELAVQFIDKYQPQSLNCRLYDGVVETLEYLKKQGIHLYILSASERNNLLQQCEHFQIVKYFDEILGIDNIHAGGKVDIAKEFMKKSKINPKETIFVGDTLHDYEVSQAMGVGCRLVSCGHQSRSRLEQAGVKIYEDIRGLKGEIK